MKAFTPEDVMVLDNRNELSFRRYFIIGIASSAPIRLRGKQIGLSTTTSSRVNHNAISHFPAREIKFDTSSLIFVNYHRIDVRFLKMEDGIPALKNWYPSTPACITLLTFPNLQSLMSP